MLDRDMIWKTECEQFDAMTGGTATTLHEKAYFQNRVKRMRQYAKHRLAMRGVAA